jgi:hypothetical protein
MPHEVDGHAGIPVELLLERQDREHSTHAAGHLPDTAAPPRPELGRDEVDDGDAGTAGDARQPQVELRKIDHDERARPLLDEPGLEQPIGTVQPRDAAERFARADHGMAAHVGDDLHARGGHARTRPSR